MPGIKVEEICGGSAYKGQVWLDAALQIYSENGKEAYREIGHFKSGAPFLFGEQARISLSHTKGLLAVATLPPTPEVTLGDYSDRAALGIDCERADRSQVLKVRDRFLRPDELAMIPADDLQANLIAWTAKEAAYKAALGEVGDFREDIRIVSLPKPGPATPVYDQKEFGEIVYGKAVVTGGDTGVDTEFTLYSYLSEGGDEGEDSYIVTLAFSPKCAKWGKGA